MIRSITSGQLELVKLLIKNGADVNLPWNGPTRWTPLMFAHDSPGILAELLAAGADVKARAAAHPLKAAENGSFSRCGGETALHLAAAANNAESVKLLTQAGADVEAKAENGCGPMDYAVPSGSPTAAAVALAEAGAQMSRSLSYQIPTLAAALVEGGALLAPDVLKKVYSEVCNPNCENSSSISNVANSQSERVADSAHNRATSNPSRVEVAADDTKQSEWKCPYCHSLLYSRVPKLCGLCGRLLPPGMLASEPSGPALDDHRKRAQDIADKFDPPFSEKGGKSSIGSTASEVPEWLLQQVPWAEVFKNRKRTAFKLYELGYYIAILIPAFIIMLFLRVFPSTSVVVATLILIAFLCYRAWNRASPICPNCKRDITLCHADYCHVCGNPLHNKRCQVCAVDDSWTGYLRPLGSTGNSRRVAYCPGCGVFLDSRVSRWRFSLKKDLS